MEAEFNMAAGNLADAGPSMEAGPSVNASGQLRCNLSNNPCAAAPDPHISPSHSAALSNTILPDVHPLALVNPCQAVRSLTPLSLPPNALNQ
jgi:hypothetical protein